MSLGLIKIISTEFDKLKRLVPKFLYRGNKDLQTAIQIAPYGIDSNPIKDMVAVMGETNQDGSTVVIGYLNKNCLAAPGEVRLFATNAQGVLQTYVWLKTDGKVHIAGDVDNAVRWRELNISLQNEVTALNAELTKIATALNGIIPGIYPMVPVQVNIDSAKINEIRTT